jgi:hypothetical protein
MRRKALQPSSQPIELAAFYTPAKQHVPSTYQIALQAMPITTARS